MKRFEFRVLMVVFGLVSLASAFAQSPVHVNPIPGLTSEFIRGADISTLDALEKAGVVYRDDADRPADLLAVLKSHGVNWIRLRLWNDPTNDADVIEGQQVISRKGDPAGGGNNDLATTVRLARRVKSAGLKFLLDFHYSDFWADPGHQSIPKAWKGLDRNALANAIYHYTKSALTALKAAGAEPDMVQLGNEINNGMLWPQGKLTTNVPGEVVGGFDALNLFLSRAAQAVRETDPRIKIAIHLANGGDQPLYRWFFDELTQRGLDFDVIGFSYYPYWHGPLADLQANLDAVAARYQKPVVVLETAYARTVEDADGYSNAFGKGMDLTGGYRATVQGQATEIRDVMAAVAAVPDHRGLGVFYWEPAWIYVKGVGWRTGAGNNWDNQTLFDFRGHPLPSLSVFLETGERGTTVEPKPVTAVDPIVDVALDQPRWNLPSTVLCAYDDDAYRSAPVTWQSLNRADVMTPQTIILKGRVTGTAVPVSATLRVAATSNLISDPSFESGQWGDWSVDGTPGTALIENNPGNAHTGAYTLKYWKDHDFHFVAHRTLHGLANGQYQVSIWAMGGGGETGITLSAWGSGQEPRAVKIRNTGWLKWAQYTAPGIQVSDSTLELSISVDGKNGNWGNFDDVVVQRLSEKP